MKKIIALLTSIMTIFSISTAPLSVSAGSMIPSDLEKYDYYTCNDYYWINENGEKEHSYIDRYYQFENEFRGTYYESYRIYSHVFVTTSDDNVVDTISSMIGAEEETAYYYIMSDNQHAFAYSPDVNYENLYNIPGVEAVELAKYLFIGGFSKDVRFYAEDVSAEENGIIDLKDKLLMSYVETESDVTLTPNMFVNTGYTVQHVYEVEPGLWAVYFDFDGMASYTNFDQEVMKMDGVISSSVSIELQESGEQSFLFDLVEPSSETVITSDSGETEPIMTTTVYPLPELTETLGTTTEPELISPEFIEKLEGIRTLLKAYITENDIPAQVLEMFENGTIVITYDVLDTDEVVPSIQSFASENAIDMELFTLAARDIETGTMSSETTTTSTTEVPCLFYGDSDLDGKVELQDMVLILKYVAEMVDFNTQQLANSDCNVDGVTDEQDALCLLRFLVKLIDSLPEVEVIEMA